MPKFLLHTCCAPCSIAVIEELKDQHDLTVYFFNPNIHPEEEYLKRKSEVIRVCEEWGVKMIDADYDPVVWHRWVKGLESEPEGGLRCKSCFIFRLKKTAEYAKANGYKIFGTSLTSGRNKKAKVINYIGKTLADMFDLTFTDEDWKKGGRQERGRKLVEERAIYRQNYCGCVYSK